MNDFSVPSPEVLHQLMAEVGPEVLSQDPEVLRTYGHDWTEDLQFLPSAVAKPTCTQQVQRLVQWANRCRVPVVPCGARTGLSGGMLPVHGGIVLSLERMNRILNIDLANLQVTYEPGVVTQVLQEAVEAHGLYYPPDPSSRGSCTLGGNLAENAGGAHAVKYGITGQYVLALEAVTGAGEIIHTGARVLKNSTGYNLTQLLVGSEGTLAIITQATSKLVAKPRFNQVLLVPFARAQDACEAVSALFRAGLDPSALEFMEVEALAYAQNYLNLHSFELDGVEAHLIVEFDGQENDAVFAACEKALSVLQQHNCGEVLHADDETRKANLWRLRRCIGEAVKGNNVYKEEDTVVPRAQLAQLLSRVKALGRAYGFRSICYGHAGDGNLHINILRDDLTDRQWQVEVPEAIRSLFAYVKELGGTISGEHGIGWVQKPFMDVMFSPYELELQRQLKRVFDPNGILNPGKIFPDA